MTTSTETAPGIYLNFDTLTGQDTEPCTLCHTRPSVLAVNLERVIDNGHEEHHHTLCTDCAEHHAFAFTLDLDAHLKGLARYRDESDTRWADERGDGLAVARAAYGRMRVSCVPLLAALGYAPEEIAEATGGMTGFVTRTEMTTVRTV